MAGWTALGSAAPAFASCTGEHTGVQGKDSGNTTAFGNKGFIYVNTDTVINNLKAAMARSHFLILPSGYNVEIGWAANENGHKGPIVYAEWEINNVTQPPSYDPRSNGHGLATDSNFRFKVENLGDQGIFRFVFDDDSTPFVYSPTLPHNYGQPVDQSEHYNSCDSLYTHQYDLYYQITLNPDWAGYEDLECSLNDPGDGWYFHKNSNSDFDVTQNSSSCP